MQSKVFWKSSTIWLNSVLFVTSVLALLPTSFDLTENQLKIVMFVIGVLGILNRILSSGTSDITLTEKE